MLFSKNNPVEPSVPDAITQELYKRNSELAVRNKTLSLLKELYQVSILTLEPSQLASKVTLLVQQALELEFIVIYSYEEDQVEAIPLGASWSGKFEHIFKTTTGVELKVGPLDKSTSLIKNILKNSEPIIENWVTIWPQIDDEHLHQLQEMSHVESVLIYPLTIEDKRKGLLVYGLNHSYDELSQFEKDAISNIANVIAVAIDRATLDLRLKVANEKLKELDKQKTEFVSIASHQLRSPLTAIKGYSSMLLEGSFGQVDGKVREAVDRIFESSQRLVGIIEDFLNITRIELGKMKYEMAEFDLKELVNEITKELRPTIEKKGLKLNFTQTEEVFLIYADRGKIAQVVSNVIDNASKYTPEGSVSVELERRGDKILLSIKDTGIGIEATTLPKLFEKFIRADDAGQTNIHGTGLGLYVAKQIVEGHHGRLWAESEGKGKGSQFYVEFDAK